MTNPATSDDRLAALRDFAVAHLRMPALRVEPASEDASFRRYFRITSTDGAPVAEGHHSVIAMDAPPPMEDCRPYVRIAGLLIEAGVHAPAVIAQDIERGFLLLSDLGSTTYAAALTDESAHALYLDAIEALVRWQQSSRERALPPYDEALLAREIDLFPDWYVERHLQRAFSEGEAATFRSVRRIVLDNNLAQPGVFVHRDYHSRNLMVATPNPGVLDFQDAVYGPVTYDIVSLLRDAYIEWKEERELDWAIRYWERARKARLPVRTDFSEFWRDYEWMGVQRQLKVLGIFARLFHRDGKDRYLADMPRVLSYLRRACGRYRELAPLLRLLDALHDEQPQVGYTF